jgi:hypothetical protein
VGVDQTPKKALFLEGVMIRKWLSLVTLFLGLRSAATGAESSAGLTAVLTRVDGAVQLAGPGVERAPLARLWQVIRAGVTIRVPEAGAAGIVCSNHRLVRLRGPVSWTLTEQTCGEGKELTPGEYALAAPQAGRFKMVHGLLTLERDIRVADQEDPLAPVIVTPRNTVVRLPRPAVYWSRVPQAIEYRVEWSEREATVYDTTSKAKDIACTAESGGAEVCVLPWPSDRPDLPPDETFLLRISARTGLVEPWHESKPIEVHTQRLSAARILESRLQDLEKLGLEGPAQDVARAGLFAGEGLYADAAEACRKALALAPSPELRVTLADIEFTVGLHQRAEVRYREALAEGEPPVRAAATFGLGRLYYARGHYREATAAFRQAREGYASLGLDEEEDAAWQAEEKATVRASKN